MKELSNNPSKPRERQSRNNKVSSYSNKKYTRRGGERSPQRAKVQVENEKSADKNREKNINGLEDMRHNKGQLEFNKNNSYVNVTHSDNRKKQDKNYEPRKGKSAKRNKREFQSIDEIKSDISRIEKEIYLEIAEFRNITLD